MIVLGLLLMAAAAAFGVELFVSNNHTETVGEVFGQDITRLSAAGYYLLGSATTVALFFGVLLLDTGLRRARKRRAERDEFEARQVEVARQAQWERSAAVTEAERLREALVEERMSQATLGGVVMPPDVDAPGEVTTGPAAPVDDPEHAEEDHRGVLGRLRHDRDELPDAPTAASQEARPAKPAKAGAAPKAKATAKDAPPKAETAEASRPLARGGVTPQPRAAAPRRAAAPPATSPTQPQAPQGEVPRTESGTPVPRPEVATDAFNAALAPAADREKPPAS